MKKRVWGIVILIVLACVVFIWLIKAPILSSYFSGKLGVKVSAGSIAVFPNHMKIKRFRLHNPKGFLSRTAFQAEEINALYSWSELTGDPNVIDEIVINNIHLDVEVTDAIGRTTNWTAILNNMPAETSGMSNHFIIKKLILNNVKVEIRGLGLGKATQTKTIARMEFDNIDSEQGFPIQELVTKIFGNAGLMQFIESAIPGGGILKVLPFGSKKKEAGDFSPAFPDLKI